MAQCPWSPCLLFGTLALSGDRGGRRPRVPKVNLHIVAAARGAWHAVLKAQPSTNSSGLKMKSPTASSPCAYSLRSREQSRREVVKVTLTECLLFTSLGNPHMSSNPFKSESLSQHAMGCERCAACCLLMCFSAVPSRHILRTGQSSYETPSG